MKAKLSLFLLSLLPSFASFSADLPKKPLSPAIDAETKLVMRSIGERYKKLQKWEAKFSQETYSIGLGKGTYNEGRFIFEAPNRFRYTIVRPDASDYISNGKKAWYISYRDGRTKPAYVRVFPDVSKVELDRYLIILRGIDISTAAKEKKFLTEFRPIGKSTPTDLRLDLTPTNSDEISQLTLIFKNDEAALSQAILTDSLGNKTTISVTVHKALKKVDSKEFEPDYPKGSTIEKF